MYTLHNKENMVATEKKRGNFKNLASRLTRKSAGKKSLSTGKHNGVVRTPLKPRNGVSFQSDRNIQEEKFIHKDSRSAEEKLAVSNSNNEIQYRTIEEGESIDRDVGDETRIAANEEKNSVCIQDKVDRDENSNDSSDDELDAELVAIYDRVMREKESTSLNYLGSQEITSLNQTSRSGRQNPAHPGAIINPLYPRSDTFDVHNEIYRPKPQRNFFRRESC